MSYEVQGQPGGYLYSWHALKDSLTGCDVYPKDDPGVFVPSFTYVSRVEVAASAEHAWSVFHDETRMGEWMTGFKENELFAFILENDFMFVDVDITFVEQDGKTEIKATSVVEGKNFLWKSLFVFMKSAMANSSQGMYDNLKKGIETTPVASDSSMVN